MSPVRALFDSTYKLSVMQIISYGLSKNLYFRKALTG